MEKIWFEQIGDGRSPDTAYRSGLPDHIERHDDECAPTDFANGKNTPATTTWCCWVHSKDIPEIRAYLQSTGRDIIPESSVPEKDFILISMLQQCKTNGALDLENKADLYFDNIKDIGSAGTVRKEYIKSALSQAKLRGLSSMKAESIRARHNLPSFSNAPKPNR